MGRPKKTKSFEPRTFRLLKELPELKKGSVLGEREDGYYVVRDSQYIKHVSATVPPQVSYIKDAVEKEPKWFVEVFPAVDHYVTKEQLEQFKRWKTR